MRWVVAVAAVVLVVLLGLLASREVARTREGRGPVSSPKSDDIGSAPEAPAAPEAEKEEGRGEEEGETALRIKVVSRRDGRPIAGARIIGDKERVCGMTGEDGVAECDPPGNWWFASAPGYFSVNGESDGDGNGWVALPPATVVTGRVFELATGEGVAGAAIALLAADEGLGYEFAKSGEDGRFEVVGALWQSFSIEVRADGYVVASHEGQDLTGPLHGIAIGLAKGATLEGHVFDADGMPVADAGVWIKADGESVPHLGARSDEQGMYRIAGVPLGVELVPWVNSVEPCAGDMVVFRDAGEVQQRDIRVPAPAFLTVAAHDADGEPVDIHSMWLELGDRRLSPDREKTGAFFKAAAGRYVLKVEPYGWPEQAREVTLVAGRRQQEELVLSGGLAIEGSLVKADGSAVGWTVHWSSDELRGMARSDVLGHFRIRGLSAAPVRLEVSAWDSFASRDGVMPGGPPVVIVLQPAARIIGRLAGTSGADVLRMHYWCDSCSCSTGGMKDDGQFELFIGYLGEPIVLAFLGDSGPPLVVPLPPLSFGEMRDLGEIRFPEGCDLHGRIVGADGKPVVGALVEVAEPWAEESTPRPTRSDETGSFRLFRLPSGPVRLRVDAKGYPPHFPILDGPDAEIRLSAGGLAEGPGTGTFRLAAVSEWAPSYVDSGPADASDRFRMQLQAGEYKGWVKLADGESFAVVPFVVREGETTKVEIKPR